ncbi:fatty-acyl-CoA synthase [Trichodelitschia bisporula]|uniref:Fatty-acyl-CoA synthase n=1 Tax=Trichodelitschia bisporula TaxID=703511 RepID=A0A6G1I6A5_9PEZI|nr:fatty-acyl-CoA synthase [Trichodelitschia bisporula]
MAFLPVAAAVAGTTAAAAYLDAKFHISHDLRMAKAAPDAKPTAKFMEESTKAGRILTYHVLEDQARIRPNDLFIMFEGREHTYGNFFDHVTRIGNWLLKDLDVQKDEIVAVDGGNSPEYLMLWFALEGIGACPSYINNNLTSKSLVHCVELCGCRYLLGEEDFRANIEPCGAELQEKGIQTLYYSWTFLSALSDTTPLPAERNLTSDLTSLNSLIYTSGSTGLPKGVPMIKGRELLIGRSIAAYLQLRPGDRMYTCMPLYHGAAHGLCVTPVIHSGAAIILGRKFSHARFWPEVRAGKANMIQYVGELCRYLINAPPSPQDKDHCVKMAWGNGMRPDVWPVFRERFGIETINELYAATDGMGGTYNPNRGPFTQGAIGLRGLLWRLNKGNVEVRVRIDPDTEEILRGPDGWAIKCRDGEAGETLHALDPNAQGLGFAGYHRNEAAGEKRKIRDVFRKGDLWFRSGDMQRQLPDGRVYFVDRLGDTFRWKSENVSTNEVADVIGTHPHVAEANVFGVSVPHADGRCGCAAIVPAEGVSVGAEDKPGTLDFADLARHALAQLPRYAVPIFIRVTPALDYTGTLKMQKGRLKREGVDPAVVGAAGDRLFWLPPGKDAYVPFGPAEWEALQAEKVRL